MYTCLSICTLITVEHQWFKHPSSPQGERSALVKARSWVPWRCVILGGKSWHFSCFFGYNSVRLLVDVWCIWKNLGFGVPWNLWPWLINQFSVLFWIMFRICNGSFQLLSGSGVSCIIYGKMARCGGGHMGVRSHLGFVGWGTFPCGVLVMLKLWKNWLMVDGAGFMFGVVPQPKGGFIREGGIVFCVFSCGWSRKRLQGFGGKPTCSILCFQHSCSKQSYEACTCLLCQYLVVWLNSAYSGVKFV